MNGAQTIDTTDHRELIAHWFAEHQAGLAYYLVRLTGDEEQAAELLQDTFVRALDAMRKGVPPANPYAWLHRIATNLAYNAFRRRNRFRWLPLSGHEREADLEQGVVLADTVRRCLSRLGAKEAEALLLYEYGGLSCIEIARLTGEEPSTIRVRVFRARERFRSLYEKERNA